MLADDPRHGTNAGYSEHTKTGDPACFPCRRAKADYERRRSNDAYLGRPRKVPSLGVKRRIQALQRLGWSAAMIARESGWSAPQNLDYALRGETCSRRTYDRIAQTYDRLSMVLPPNSSASARARNRAARLGYAPPLAWDDIDNDAAPVGVGYTQKRTGNQHAEDKIDPVVVMRLLEGERVPSTSAERQEAMAVWVANGGTRRELASWHGWRAERYTTGLRVVQGGAA